MVHLAKYKSTQTLCIIVLSWAQWRNRRADQSCSTLLASISVFFPPPPLVEEEAALGNSREEEKNKAELLPFIPSCLSHSYPDLNENDMLLWLRHTLSPSAFSLVIWKPCDECAGTLSNSHLTLQTLILQTILRVWVGVVV